MNAISLNRALNAGSFYPASIPRSASIPNPTQTPNTSDEQSASSIPKTSTPALESSSVEISKAGRAKAKELERSSKSDKPNANNLTDEEKAQVAELQKSDRQTRAHEQAHLGAAGGLAKGGASFSFTKGPDGRLYAVGGEVSIDTTPVPGNPDATIRKADTIRRAALAPSEPSSQDKSVAAQAAKMANQARAEKLRNKQADVFSTANDAEYKSDIESRFNPTSELGEILDLVA